jgi:hypothetical protein
MNVYFSASISAKEQFMSQYKSIVDYLKLSRHNVFSDHIFDSTESSIRNTSPKERINFHEQIENWIRSCDFMVVEASHPSVSVGYEIFLALRVDKPVLILYTKEAPSLLAHNKNDRVVCMKYTPEEIPEIIEDFITQLPSKNELRFTFTMTSKITYYLNQLSKQINIPKSIYLRQLIERDMEKNNFV